MPDTTTLTHCPKCRAPLLGRTLYERFRICDECEHHFPIDVDRRVTSLVDSGSFVELDRALASTDPLLFADAEPYRDKLRQAQTQFGRGDAATYGRATLYGNPISLLILDFSFLGGSMGVVVGEKLARAAELARREKRALVTDRRLRRRAHAGGIALPAPDGKDRVAGPGGRETPACRSSRY